MVDPVTLTAAAVGVIALSEGTKTAIKTLTERMLGLVADKAGKSVSAVLTSFSRELPAYLERQYERHYFLPTIVFQNPIPLVDLYIPLTVVSETVGSGTTSKKQVKLNIFHPDFIPSHKKILVTDAAGMGKSTLLRFLMLRAIETKAAVPIFVELRHLSESRSTMDLLVGELNSLGDRDTPALKRTDIARLLSKGGFTFFLDGYDEISSKDREVVTKDIKRLIEEFSKNNFIISSRPESGLPSFVGFQHFRIQPLKLEESFALLRKYDRGGPRSEQLIAHLKSSPELAEVREFLQNPLLTTLLYRCYEYKNQIPLKKNVFYRQVYDALYDWHDSTKDGYNTRQKRSRLDIDAFHRVLRALGFVFVMSGKVEGEQDEVLQWIRDARAYCPGIVFPESDFLEDTIRAVPVLCRDGTAIKWSHKSMAEYFCAAFLVSDLKDKQDDVCRAIAESAELSRFSNVLDLVYDLDSDLFRYYFVVPLKRWISSSIGDWPRELDSRISMTSVRLRVALTATKDIYVFSPTIPIERIEALVEQVTKATERNSLGNGFARDNFFFTPLSESKIGKRDPQTLFLGYHDHPLQTVINVLQSKRDPLFRSASRLFAENVRGGFRGLRGKGPVRITRESTAVWNRPSNFDYVNAGLVRSFGGALDVDALMSVSSELTAARAVDLTDRLVASIRGK